MASTSDSGKRPDQAIREAVLEADSSHPVFKHFERLSERVWKWVEDDDFDEQPHLYCIKGEQHAVVFDTGTGKADYRAFLLSKPDFAGLPLLVVNSHCHYDHIGSNYRFSPASDSVLPKGVSGLCMGSASRQFSEAYNAEDTSLGKAAGCAIRDFKVTFRNVARIFTLRRHLIKFCRAVRRRLLLLLLFAAAAAPAAAAYCTSIKK